PESVHLCAFPEAEGSRRDPALEEAMAAVQTVVRLGRQLRAEHELKVRQPLSRLHVVTADAEARDRVAGLREIVLEELNVKELLLGADETELADLRAKPNYRRLGPRCGAAMRQVASAIGEMPAAAAARLAAGGGGAVEVDGRRIELEPDDVVIERTPKPGFVAATEGPLLVALDTTLTDALRLEGLAREEINRIQNRRKALGLELTQRIRIEYGDDTDAEVRRVHEAHRATIDTETLCVGTAYAAPGGEAAGWEVADLNGHRVAFRIIPARG
ncbi:MAG: isoleucine--tRNA ligase, partial [Lentisphaerae bacterium]|nr:isoleucine--tRNA ligase [Lentisphaerota bacterium]